LEKSNHLLGFFNFIHQSGGYMQKKDCTQCLYFTNFGCSKQLPMFTDCEHFVDWEEAYAVSEGRASLTARATSAGGSAAQPASSKDEDED